jgi:hypothetical protein
MLLGLTDRRMEIQSTRWPVSAGRHLGRRLAVLAGGNGRWRAGPACLSVSRLPVCLSASPLPGVFNRFLDDA